LDVVALTQEKAVALKVGPGDEVYMVGRLLAHAGRVTNNPVARFGNVSLMPNVKELVRDGRGKDVEAYLIEMRSHAGFSGSPVFLLIPQGTFRGEIGDTSLEDQYTRFRLLGIDTGHKLDHLDVLSRTSSGWEKRPDLDVEHFTDVAVVAPIWKVVNLLERGDFATERLRIGREMERLRGNERAVSDVASDGSEFARFQELTSKLLEVPKTELDAKLRAEKGDDSSAQ
jgi:hypothetical protein